MFVVLAPSLDHLIKHDTTVEYVTWRKRGWCRAEAVAKVLSCAKTVGPTIVIQSTTNVFLSQMLLATQPIGDGDFGCCEMNHKLTLPDGTVQEIACDKSELWALLLHGKSRSCLLCTFKKEALLNTGICFQRSTTS